MPDIKKHYKIFIAILIVIILISSFIIYDITPKNNITYNVNGKNMDLKYFNNLGEFEYKYFNLKNYTESSDYINHENISYLNSTIVNPYIFSGGCNIYCISYGINIHLTNVNDKYIYLIIKSPDCKPHGIFTNNSNIIKTTDNNNLYTYKLQIINDNKNITIKNSAVIPFYNDCNISIKIELNNNFYNLFNIHTIKETAIYGEILNTHGQLYNVNTTLLIENTNNSNYRIMHVINGYFYNFLKPDTEYKIYSIRTNNTLELITTTPANLTINKSFYYNIPYSEL